jgi:hypothetical protein
MAAGLCVKNNMGKLFADHNPIQDFLGQTIIVQPYVYIDFWSVVHFSSGFILGTIFAVYFPKRFAWLIVLGVLIAYEIFEVALDGILFVPETMTDKVWDIFIGMTGFFISYLLIKEIKKISTADKQ